MFVEAIGQHLCVASREDAISASSDERGFWNIISIHGAMERRAELIHARNVHYACFDDTEDAHPGNPNRAATHEDLARVFEFAESVGDRPLLVHCFAGLSRSPAVALAWICRRLPPGPQLATQAVDILLALQPEAMPNELILRRGLSQFLSKPEAEELASELLRHPELVANRLR
jgi:predicted protein tyrosine phosphatase